MRLTVGIVTVLAIAFSSKKPVEGSYASSRVAAGALVDSKLRWTCSQPRQCQQGRNQHKQMQQSTATAATPTTLSTTLYSSSRARLFATTPTTTTTSNGQRSWCDEDGADKLVRSSSASRSTNTDSAGPTGLYIHIPFCRRRCRYCNFAIVPIGTMQQQEPLWQTRLAKDYTNAVRTEMEVAAGSSSSQPIAVHSVYVGGGTPSLAPIEMLQQLLGPVIRVGRDYETWAGPEQEESERATNAQANPRFAVDNEAEWTIEMDPGTFTLDKLQAIRSMGFNRISLGVQSFDDSILERLGRVHRESDIYESIAMLQQVYGEELNYSIDLISGLPGLSCAKWAEALETAVHLNPKPTHLSLYDLQIEPGTVFGKWYGDDDSFARTRTNQIVSLPSEDDSAFMYKYAAGYLRTKGYEHYEVSSYALRPLGPGGTVTTAPSPFRSQHNQVYWDINGQWYAFGLGATSYLNNKVETRPKALADYIDWVGLLKQQSSSVGRADLLPDDDDDSNLSAELDQLMDIILKRLRTTDGLSLDWVRTRYGERHGPAYYEAILRGSQLGRELDLINWDEKKSLMQLVDPQGLLLSNTLISNIFVELEKAVDRLRK